MTNHPPNKAAREVELKLAVPADTIDAVLERLQGPSEKKHAITTYFDTVDQALTRIGVSLRVRQTDGKRVQTVKADSVPGVAADRAEWEWLIDQDSPDLSLLAETPIAEKLPVALDLKPVVVTDIHRTIWVLNLEAATVVEAALDEGAIVAGQARVPVCELELELRTGSPAPLFRSVLELHAAIPVTIESESKFARGERLRTGTAAEAHKAGDAAIAGKTRTGDAFRLIVSGFLGHLLANQPAAMAGDAEGIHQMRVAIRRLRAALTLFEPVLAPHITSSFQAELRRIGRVFGEARDWDVFTQQILPDALHAAGAEEWRHPLEGPARVHRVEAHRRFCAEVLAPPFTALVLVLAALVEDRTLLGGDKLERPIEDVCSQWLLRLARKAEKPVVISLTVPTLNDMRCARH